MKGNKAECIALVICAALLGTGWYDLELGQEPDAPSSPKLVEVLTWNWRKDRTGKTLAVFGSVRNNTSESFTSVVLELRTEDASKIVIDRHTILVGPLGPNTEKPFREDISRSGLEAMGYLEVRSLAR